jgi:hypothetical protein
VQRLSDSLCVKTYIAAAESKANEFHEKTED